MNKMGPGAWPPLPYLQWQETCTALHLWSQVVGRYRLARAPWVNHSWHATLYITPRGLTTGPVPDVGATVTLAFDFRDHALIAETEHGASESFSLEPMSVADFYHRTKALLAKVGATPVFHGSPSESALTVEDAMISPGPAAAIIRAATCTAMPASRVPSSSHSPV
jgi:hypothetical protein